MENLGSRPRKNWYNVSMLKRVAGISVFFGFPLAAHAFVAPPIMEIIKPVPTATYYIDAATGEGGDGSFLAPNSFFCPLQEYWRKKEKS
ncbi:MAG: hypothetical protein A2219_00520 [Elusimicrobia bacterium RIFOXYA2_FULL_50_26]|nr:MAG: hypothetical protein A2219_00520 [Elusimicrobia bacterium RIFOXYA2_FULL_50_26]